MAVKYFTPKDYGSLKMLATMTLFENAGDSLRYAYDLPDAVPVINSNNYHDRHTVFTGSFTGSLPGLNRTEGSIGYVWPEDGVDYNPGSEGFYIEAIEDNTQLHCVHPYPGNTLDVKKVELLPGDSHTISKGTLSLIFGDSFTVNGNASTDNPKILVCQNNDAVIVTATDCKIVKFTILQ